MSEFQDQEQVLLLSFISAVGCAISMLGLIATVICHGLVWRYEHMLSHDGCCIFACSRHFISITSANNYFITSDLPMIFLSYHEGCKRSAFLA